MFISEQTRGADGRYTRLEVTLVDAAGRERVYVLRGAALRQSALNGLAGGLAAAGVAFPKSKSLDIRPDVESEEPELDEDLAELEEEGEE